jgi:hypothetical protein
MAAILQLPKGNHRHVGVFSLLVFELALRLSPSSVNVGDSNKPVGKSGCNIYLDTFLNTCLQCSHKVLLRRREVELGLAHIHIQVHCVDSEANLTPLNSRRNKALI